MYSSKYLFYFVAFTGLWCIHVLYGLTKAVYSLLGGIGCFIFFFYYVAYYSIFASFCYKA